MPEGHTIHRIARDHTKLAADLGYHVVDRIVDNDRSASRKARRVREGFDRMLEMAQAGAVDAVIAYNLDRFTRNPDELGAWLNAAERTGIEIHTTGTIIELGNPDHRPGDRRRVNDLDREVAERDRRANGQRRPVAIGRRKFLVTDSTSWLRCVGSHVEFACARRSDGDLVMEVGGLRRSRIYRAELLQNAHRPVARSGEVDAVG